MEVSGEFDNAAALPPGNNPVPAGLSQSENYCRREMGIRWHCASSRKVAGLIPDGAIGILH
jgi:hypothetical protein